MSKDKFVLYPGQKKFDTKPMGNSISIIGKIRDICPVMATKPRDRIDEVIDQSYNLNTDSFDADNFIYLITGFQYHNEPQYDGTLRIFITDKKMHTKATKEAYGKGIPSKKGLGTTVISTYLMKKPEELSVILLHELGHIYLTPRKNRPNSIKKKGIHCINECIMQPRDFKPNHIELLCDLVKSKEIPYCKQCCEDIKSYSLSLFDSK